MNFKEYITEALETSVGLQKKLQNQKEKLSLAMKNKNASSIEKWKSAIATTEEKLKKRMERERVISSGGTRPQQIELQKKAVAIANKMTLKLKSKNPEEYERLGNERRAIYKKIEELKKK